MPRMQPSIPAISAATRVPPVRYSHPTMPLVIHNRYIVARVADVVRHKFPALGSKEPPPQP